MQMQKGINYLDKEKTIEELIDSYGKKLTNFVYTYVKDWGIAEDITQEVFITVFKKLDSFNNHSSLKTWVYTIAANKSKDYLRKGYFKKNILSNMIRFIMSEEKTPEKVLLEKVHHLELAESFMKLPVNYREVIFLYYYEELSTTEISELLETKISTVKSRLIRARKILKNHFQERGDS